MTVKSFQRQRGEAESADRYRVAWQLRRAGATYRVIGESLGVKPERARQIVLRAERRLIRACEFARPVDPISYGVWHEFTPEGRVGLWDECHHP